MYSHTKLFLLRQEPLNHSQVTTVFMLMMAKISRGHNFDLLTGDRSTRNQKEQSFFKDLFVL